MPPAAVAALAAMPPPAAVAFSSPNISPVPASDTMWDAMLPAVSPNRLEISVSSTPPVPFSTIDHMPDLIRLSNSAFCEPSASLEAPAVPLSSGLVKGLPLPARVEPASSAPRSSSPMPWVTSGSAFSSLPSSLAASLTPLFSSLVLIPSAIFIVSSP